ncbi:MAG: aldehyde dehydrogenase [Synergistaceae bacterium]|nr:aldehyde dehydrogenase [Synergistaceae bacterium]
MNDARLEELVKKILLEDMRHSGENGVCLGTNEAVARSKKACALYADLKLQDRKRIIESIKRDLYPHVVDIARMNVEETLLGNVEDKLTKITLALEKTPGIEDLVTEVWTGDEGMTLSELSPWGIVCAVHPCTNPCATLINNTISMLAAGNSVIHIPHPRASNVTKYLTGLIGDSIFNSCGIENLVVTFAESSMAKVDELMSHPDVQMTVVTGNMDVLRKALCSGRKVIGAGPANPVAIVDGTANIEKAARDIVSGASFDNNILCITEKSVVATDDIADDFILAAERNGARVLRDDAEALSLTTAAINYDRTANKLLEGKDAATILKESNIGYSDKPKVILFETFKENPFVTQEIMMPILPVVRARNFEEAVAFALEIEQGLRHTATLHSKNIEHLNYAAKTLQTSVFVKNAPSLKGIGMNAACGTSFTIATATGEGITTARTFARRRRCVLDESFSIR